MHFEFIPLIFTLANTMVMGKVRGCGYDSR